MPELGPYGSVRGARGNSRLYRDLPVLPRVADIARHRDPTLCPALWIDGKTASQRYGLARQWGKVRFARGRVAARRRTVHRRPACLALLSPAVQAVNNDQREAQQSQARSQIHQATG